MADADKQIEFVAADLAPGDARSLELDSREHPQLAGAYEKLWVEFGAAHEMEAREVIERRLAWHPAERIGGCWLRYEMILIRRRGEFVAVRDHTAVVTRPGGVAQAVVHLSHVLVEPAWRRTGLAGWLRAWPIQTARACLAAAGFPEDSSITLVAEMEHPDAPFPNRMIRLKAYEKAGFQKVDHGVVKYFQPDFRPAAEIDASGGPRPLPFGLIVRRVGREQERFIRGAEVREMVECLYRMYGTGFREQDMGVVRGSLRNYPGDDAVVPLVLPTQ
jgi:GNAT superfamily N-acetyltransferase